MKINFLHFIPAILNRMGNITIMNCTNSERILFNSPHPISMTNANSSIPGSWKHNAPSFHLNTFSRELLFTAKISGCPLYMYNMYF